MRRPALISAGNADVKSSAALRNCEPCFIEVPALISAGNMHDANEHSVSGLPASMRPALIGAGNMHDANADVSGFAGFTRPALISAGKQDSAMRLKVNGTGMLQ